MTTVAIVANKVRCLPLFCANFLSLSPSPTIPLPHAYPNLNFKRFLGTRGVILKDQYTRTNGGELQRVYTNEHVNRAGIGFSKRVVLGVQIFEIYLCGTYLRLLETLCKWGYSRPWPKMELLKSSFLNA